MHKDAKRFKYFVAYDQKKEGLYCPERNVWPRTAASVTVNKRCPPGWSGTKSRVSSSCALAYVFHLLRFLTVNNVSHRSVQSPVFGNLCNRDVVSHQKYWSIDWGCSEPRLAHLCSYLQSNFVQTPSIIPRRRSYANRFLCAIKWYANLTRHGAFFQPTQ